jgi:type IV pilus assembly protein PilC
MEQESSRHKGVDFRMPRFNYMAIDQNGKNVRGSMEADNEKLVRSRLNEQQLHVVDMKMTKSVSFKGFAQTKKPKLQSLVIFSRQFATMVDAGIPILRCLDILSAQTKDKALKDALLGVSADVKSGLSLFEALGKHPNVFSKLYVNMIRAAELGGILDKILDRLSQFLEKEMEIKTKIKSAMMYPVLVLFFSTSMLFAIFAFVLPKFKEIFAGMDVEMPAITSTLFSIGDVFAKIWWLVIIAAIGLFIGFKFYIKTPAGHYQFDMVKLKLPIMGDLTLKLSVARFSRTFGTLIASGVPTMRSLEIVGETSGNAVISFAIDQTRNSLREGSKLSTPLAESGLFPSMVTHMIDVGEESGRLSDMLVKVADFYEQEVDAAVKGLTSMIEPLLIMFMGGMVGFIALAVMMPLFKLVSSVN